MVPTPRTGPGARRRAAARRSTTLPPRRPYRRRHSVGRCATRSRRGSRPPGRLQQPARGAHSNDHPGCRPCRADHRVSRGWQVNSRLACLHDDARTQDPHSLCRSTPAGFPRTRRRTYRPRAPSGHRRCTVASLSRSRQPAAAAQRHHRRSGTGPVVRRSPRSHTHDHHPAHRLSGRAREHGLALGPVAKWHRSQATTSSAPTRTTSSRSLTTPASYNESWVAAADELVVDTTELTATDSAAIVLDHISL